MRSRPSWRLAALIGAGFILLSVACGTGDDSDSAGAAVEERSSRTITVSGEGRVYVEPDIVAMTLGVDLTRPDLGSVQSDAATAMHNVIGALRDLGIDESDITTSTYSIFLERDYGQPGQPVIGYRLIHLISVTVREIELAGEAIGAATAAGANSVQSVGFALDDTSAAMSEARGLAVAEARAKAEELARLTGNSLSETWSIRDGTSGASVPLYPEDAAGGADDRDAPTINPGQASVIVTVEISWLIE
jgi:uncharacterized protein YggE